MSSEPSTSSPEEVTKAVEATEKVKREPPRPPVDTTLQYGTTAFATLFFLRFFNPYISRGQRVSAFMGASGLLYLSVANEYHLFPFVYKGKEMLEKKTKNSEN